MVEHLDSDVPQVSILYKDIPNFSQCTGPGHVGKLVFGNIGGVNVVCMEGRFHLYEGFSQEQITYPVRTMAKLGIKILIVSNAAGCLIPEWNIGDIALINDHINFLFANPLIGPNENLFPPHSERFVSMDNCYDPKLRAIAKQVGEKQNQILRDGVLIPFNGPSFETCLTLLFDSDFFMYSG
jgi:purine-nucleoside phosphorylase